MKIIITRRPSRFRFLFFFKRKKTRPGAHLYWLTVERVA